MKIKVLNEIIFKGRKSGLINYQFIDDNGKPISAMFQATKSELKKLKQEGLKYSGKIEFIGG